MTGSFENQRIYLNLEISGVFAKSKRAFRALVDTGFDGYLTLPFAEAFPLGLVLTGVTSYTIADGSTMHNFVCLGQIAIDKKNISVAIDIQPKGKILAGMKLLAKIGKIMKVDFPKQTIVFS